ncbi:hypothetical protein MUK42_36945 [Musa troglodytarum]|uniref:Uncharacterized protein n=1 Tax=Musa troglodytarum TaxID=320322 RepID=A0A9E7FJH6_9LILI|nr:hypothetical protein MUK42_36945 [Musa troglodytarum]
MYIGSVVLQKGGEIGFGSPSFRSIHPSPFASIRHWRGCEERLMLDPGTPATSIEPWNRMGMDIKETRDADLFKRLSPRQCQNNQWLPSHQHLPPYAKSFLDRDQNWVPSKREINPAHNHAGAAKLCFGSCNVRYISCVMLNQVHPTASVPGYKQTQVTPELVYR